MLESAKETLPLGGMGDLLKLTFNNLFYGLYLFTLHDGPFLVKLPRYRPLSGYQIILGFAK